MNTGRQSGALERSSFRSRWRDGSVDLLGGLGILAIGAGWHMGLYWAPAFVAPALLALWVPLRKHLVEPRIGRVVFGLEQRKRKARGTRNTLLVGFLALAAVAIFQVVKVNSSAGAGPWTEEWVGALPCTLLAILAFLTAGLTGVARFALYAAVLLATALIATPAGLEPSAQLLLAGSIVTVAGFSLFVRFLARSSRSLPEGLD